MFIDWSFQSLLIPIVQIWHVKERRARDRVEQSMIVRTLDSIGRQVYARYFTKQLVTTIFVFLTSTEVLRKQH